MYVLHVLQLAVCVAPTASAVVAQEAEAEIADTGELKSDEICCREGDRIFWRMLICLSVRDWT